LWWTFLAKMSHCRALESARQTAEIAAKSNLLNTLLITALLSTT
jgi:hypothetical protein